MKNKTYVPQSGITIPQLLGVVVITGVATGTISAGVVNFIEIENSKALQSSVVQINSNYDAWSTINPDASHDAKKEYLKKELAAMGHNDLVGLAFNSADNEEICLWDRASKNETITDAISISGETTDCSAMETVVSGEKPRREDNQQEESQKESSPVVSTDPAPLFPWSILLGILASLGAAVGAGFGIAKGISKFKGTKASKITSQIKWNSLMKRHDSVRSQWASYELDPLKMLDYPMLADMREQHTVDLHLALRKANNLRPVDVKSVLHTEANNSDYENAVTELEHIFHIAETEAKRIQWSKFSNDEQKRLKTARAMLNFILDESGSEFERQTAYKRLHKEIAGLITLPAITLTEIESQMRVMIEA